MVLTWPGPVKLDGDGSGQVMVFSGAMGGRGSPQKQQGHRLPPPWLTVNTAMLEKEVGLGEAVRQQLWTSLDSSRGISEKEARVQGPSKKEKKREREKKGCRW